MGLSKLSEQCKKCPDRNICDEKRMEACAYLPEPAVATLTEPLISQAAMPVMEDQTVYNIRVDSETTVQVRRKDVLKQIQDEIYKSVRCDFLKGGS